MKTHTPTPWTVDTNGWIHGAFNNQEAPLIAGASPNNAAFIVKACNTHEILIDKSRKALQLLKEIQAKEDGGTEMPWPEINALEIALNIAQGKE